jgi:hypothetical protein
MGIPVKLPVILRVDNVGAIFIAENVLTSSRTKHTDTRHHFVREFIEERFGKIIFVRLTSLIRSQRIPVPLEVSMISTRLSLWLRRRA